LPPLSTDEFEALKADILANGIRDPIVVDEDGNILDGHHRYKICPDAPVRVVSGLSEAEKQAFVIRANMARRNLSPEQKKEVQRAQRKIAFQLKAEQRWTLEEIARLLGVSHVLVHYWLTREKTEGENAGKGITNLNLENGYTPLDCRVKIPPKLHPVILERIERGEPQTKVAADLKVSQVAIHKIVAKERRRREVFEERKAGVSQEVRSLIRHGDFREVLSDLPDCSVDLILTDPPYDDASVGLYEDIAKLGSRVLRPGGWCLAYLGQGNLLLIMDGMRRYLEYGWQFCCTHTSGDSRYRRLRLRVGFKPILAFYKPPLNVWWDWFRAVVSGGKEKALHAWQQAESEASHFIQALCPEGGIVLDPCCGSGTVLAAAKKLKRRFFGCDLDEESVITARARLGND